MDLGNIYNYRLTVPYPSGRGSAHIDHIHTLI